MIALYENVENVTYSDSFGVEHITKKNGKVTGNQNIVIDNYKVQTYDSIMCGYCCIGFIDFMLKCKSLIDY